MTHSPFPWSEGVSYVFDANDRVVCREPLLPELEGGNWNDNRKLIAAVPEMLRALEMARESILSGFGTVKAIEAIDAILAAIKTKE